MSNPTTYPKAVLEVSNLLVLKYLEEKGFKKVSKKLQKLTQTSSQECSKLHFLNLKDVHKFVERESRPKKRKHQNVEYGERPRKQTSQVQAAITPPSKSSGNSMTSLDRLPWLFGLINESQIATLICHYLVGGSNQVCSYFTFSIRIH